MKQNYIKFFVSFCFGLLMAGQVRAEYQGDYRNVSWYASKGGEFRTTNSDVLIDGIYYRFNPTNVRVKWTSEYGTSMTPTLIISGGYFEAIAADELPSSVTLHDELIANSGVYGQHNHVSFDFIAKPNNLDVPGIVRFGADGTDQSQSFPVRYDNSSLYWFKDSKVVNIKLPKAITEIPEFAFSEMSALESVTIPETVTSIGEGAFLRCPSLSKITIPESTKSIGDYAFSECENLSTVVLPGRMDYIGKYAFSWCSNLTNINLPETLTSIGELTFYGCSSLASINLPETLTSIGESAFYGCSSLTGINLPRTLTSIGEYAFSDCGLTKITIPANIKKIERGAFYCCWNLADLTISKGVESIESDAFYSCNLCSLFIPSTIAHIGLPNIDEIEYGAFTGNSNLKSIVVDSENKYYDSRNNCNAIIETKTNKLLLGCGNTVVPVGVTSIGDGAFIYDNNLTTLSLPETITEIGSYAYFSCANLHSIIIPKSVLRIAPMVFGYHPDLQTIMIEEGNRNYDSRNDCNAIIEKSSMTLLAGCKNTIIPKDVKCIGNCAFGGSKLTHITIPKSVTTINEEAFAFNEELRNVVIPKEVVSLADYAFYCCSGLSSVTSLSTNPVIIGNMSFTSDWETFTSATLYVPAGTKALYESTDGWKEFKNIVEMVTKGDLDGKGYTDVTDVVAAISCIMEEAGLTDEEVAILDMDGDGEVDVADIVKLIIEVIRHQKEQATAASARGGQPSAETVDLTQYTALQMTVTVPEGCEVTQMMLTGRNRDTHRLVSQQTGEGRYAVVVYSMENLPLQPVDGNLIAVEGAGEVVTSNVMLSTRSRERAYLNSLPAATVTGIGGVQGATTTDEPTVYDLQGRKVNAQDMRKGMYIINGKKVVR